MRLAEVKTKAVGKLEAVMRESGGRSAKEICNALLEFAVREDDALRQRGDEDLIHDKTMFIIKRTLAG
jgi:hypothetical protein